MYTALAVMLGGILCGRLCRDMLPRSVIHWLVMTSILLLLFLLGVSIGQNHDILFNLPTIGRDSLILMLFCVFGSIAVSILTTPILRRYFSVGKDVPKK